MAFVLVGPTRPSTVRRTQQNHLLPTNLDPSTRTHPVTMAVFCAGVSRFTMKAIPTILPEYSKYMRTADAPAKRSQVFGRLGACHAPHSQDYTVVWRALYAWTNNCYENYKWDKRLVRQTHNCIWLLHRQVCIFYCYM